MDLASVEGLSAIQAAKTNQEIGIKVLAKANEVAKSEAEAVLELLATAAENIDIAAQQAGGKGGLDVKV